jgi:hypothetical protein
LPDWTLPDWSTTVIPSKYLEASRSFAAAAQRVREGRQPEDIADALLVIERADNPAEKWQRIVSIDVYDPEAFGPQYQQHYFWAEAHSGRTICLLYDNARHDLSVLLDRWARWFDTRRQEMVERVERVAARAQSALQAQQAPEAAPRPVATLVDHTLDDEDLAILCTMAAQEGAKLTQQLIADFSNNNVSRKTISKRLPSLMGVGYIVRPKGRNSGMAITDAGIARLRDIDLAPKFRRILEGTLKGKRFLESTGAKLTQ